MAKRRQTYDKFRKERQRKERKEMKAERRSEKGAADGEEGSAFEGDPDLVGIVAGPQPPVDPMTGFAPLREAPPRSTPSE